MGRVRTAGFRIFGGITFLGVLSAVLGWFRYRDCLDTVTTSTLAHGCMFPSMETVVFLIVGVTGIAFTGLVAAVADWRGGRLQ